MKTLLFLLLILGMNISYAQETKDYQITVDYMHLPLNRYDTYIYTILGKNNKIKVEHIQRYYDIKNGKAVRKKWKLQPTEEQLDLVRESIEEEQKDSLSVSLGKEKKLYQDSIFRRVLISKQRNINAIIDYGIDGTSIEIIEIDKGKTKVLFKLGADVRAQTAERKKQQIIWLKFKKILDPILADMGEKDKQLPNYFLDKSKQYLLETYKKKAKQSND